MRLPEDPQVGDVWRSTENYLRSCIDRPKEGDVYLLIVGVHFTTSVYAISTTVNPSSPISNIFIRRWFTRIHKGNVSEY